jgi:antitoxin component YwqK of YwqJK toxin-antitoxin module
MKRLFYFTLLLLICLSSFSQDYKTIYYNSNWEITSYKFGKYYRNSGFDTVKMVFDSLVTDHYMDGSIEMIGSYKNGIKEGDFIYYYPNRSIKFKCSYTNNERSGIWAEYFDNGSISKEIKYVDNREKLLAINDIKGNNLLKTSYKYSFVYYLNPDYNTYSIEKSGNFSIKYKLEGNLINGYKNGTWVLTEYQTTNTLFNNKWITKETPKTLCSVKYKDGNFISGIYYLPNAFKKSILKDIFTSLILEPDKVTRTESFRFEPGQLIKQNYLIKALQARDKKLAKPIVLKKESEITDYFSANYTMYAKKCTDTLRFKITLKIDDSGKIEIQSIDPKTDSQFEKEVYRVIQTISKLENPVNHDFSFYYRILCFDELEFKR